MKLLILLLLFCAGFPHIISVRGEMLYQQKSVCIDTAGASVGNYLLRLLENSDENQTLQIEEVEKAFVPDLYNTSSFLVPRLVYVLFTCNNSEDIQDVIDDERAFVWTNEYLFVYMHPAVIRLVSLLDVTLLGPSVHTLRMCIHNVCSNATEAFSFQEAILKGAVGVEFDVVLTKDLVPVIYHDLNISISVASGGYYDVLLKDLTHDELRSFKIATKYKSKHQLTSGVPATENVRTKVFPTLKEVLDSVPESLIFNVEVKYPLPKENGEDCDCFPYTNRNVIADVVISTLYQFGAKRNMVISCFNPSLCTMLHLKQPLIPVLFLTEATTPAYSLAIDIRNKTVFDAVAFAKAQDFIGVSVCADMVHGRPEVIKLVQDNNLLLATWGKENVNDESVSWQKQHAKGIIIICDKLT